MCSITSTLANGHNLETDSKSFSSCNLPWKEYHIHNNKCTQIFSHIMVSGDCRKTLNDKSARAVLTHGESEQALAVFSHALSHTHKRFYVLGCIR